MCELNIVAPYLIKQTLLDTKDEISTNTTITDDLNVLYSQKDRSTKLQRNIRTKACLGTNELEISSVLPYCTEFTFFLQHMELPPK